MANTITAFKPNPKKPSQGFVKVSVDGTEIELWTPEIDKVAPLNGKEIPSDWKVDVEQKRLLPPRQQGQGSYRNTKEAFDAEAKSRAAWQAVEEERRDRRTALMQTVQAVAASGRGMKAGDWTEYAAPLAEEMYDWLRETSPAVTPAGEATTEANAPPPQAGGSSSGPVAAGDLGHTPGPDPGPDSTPAASGKAVARPEPGEGSVKTPLGSTIYPLDPAKCSHRFPSGRWLKWDAEDRCPRCGTPKVSAVEGTTADLGSA